MWNKAENALREVMNELGLEYTEEIGEAAFYGPKLDVNVKPAVGNEITLSTCQLDFCLPAKFQLTYVDKEDVYKRQSQESTMQSRPMRHLTRSFLRRNPPLRVSCWIHRNPIPTAFTAVEEMQHILLWPIPVSYTHLWMRKKDRNLRTGFRQGI